MSTLPSINSRPLTRWDVMKLVGLLLMFIDHAGYFYFDDQEWIRGIGRACAPIFFFLAGFAPYYKRDRLLIVLAALLTASDWWVKGAPNTLNILWTIILVRLVLAWLEARKPGALRLHEWVIGSVALIPSVIVLQYGTLGFLFALAGYVFKHRSDYAAHIPQRFLIIVAALYAVAVGLLSSFAPLSWALMAVSFAAMVGLMQWFVRAPKQAIGLPAASMLQLCARHTALIYVVHLIALGWLTGKPL